LSSLADREIGVSLWSDGRRGFAGDLELTTLDRPERVDPHRPCEPKNGRRRTTRNDGCQTLDSPECYPKTGILEPCPIHYLKLQFNIRFADHDLARIHRPAGKNQDHALTPVNTTDFGSYL
jgi:hypothetical protein